MSQQALSRFLVDTRPFPSDPVKNDLLLYASQIAEQTSIAQSKLASESLQANIYQMMQQNHYLGLSVAMSMAANPAIYKVLWDALNQTLAAKTDDEIQWFAQPIILVVGSNEDMQLDAQVPVDEILAITNQFEHLKTWGNLHFHPTLLDAQSFTQIKADDWFHAKQNLATAQQFAQNLPQSTITVASGQSVKVVYALAYGHQNDAHLAGAALQDAALHLMQVWQEHFNTGSQTIFTNPLPLHAPLMALVEGSRMRLRMACDVFTTNAIRSIRLQSPRVGVVIASQEGGRLLFGFNATESAFAVEPQVFNWPMDSQDNLESILQNFVELLAECQVENIRILHNPLKDTENLPCYARACELPSSNPLFEKVQ